LSDYVLLYSGGKMPESDEEIAAVMKGWTDWAEGLGDAMKDLGNPFTPAAKTVSADGSVSDGPVGTMATGYSIISASSLNDAVDVAKGCPVLLGGGKISVYETFEVM
jgi:hypothetical protein